MTTPVRSYDGLLSERDAIVAARRAYTSRRRQLKADLAALGKGPTGDGWEDWNWERRRVMRELGELTDEYARVCERIEQYNAKVDGMNAQGKDDDDGADS